MEKDISVKVETSPAFRDKFTKMIIGSIAAFFVTGLVEKTYDSVIVARRNKSA